MRKGKLTKEKILQGAAALFNSRGFSGASMSDVMEATGLEKGGIYNHFESKDMLAIEAFEYAVGVSGQFIVSQLEQETTAVGKLKRLLCLMKELVNNSPVPGGCPILNTAIECDDTHPLLKERVQKAMDRFRGLVERVAQIGIESGELRPEVKPQELALLIISSIEGALMMSKLYADSKLMNPVVEHLSEYVDTLVANKKRR